MKYVFQISNVIALMIILSSFGSRLAQGQAKAQEKAPEETSSATSARLAPDKPFKTPETASTKGVTRQPDTERSSDQVTGPHAARGRKNTPSESRAVEARHYYESGVALAATPNLDLAIEKFQQAIILEPANAESHFSLGVVYCKASRYKEASESFKRAVRLKPDWAEAHLRLGQTYYVLDRKNQALDEHKRLVSLNPLMADTLLRTINNEGRVTPSIRATTVVTNREPSSIRSLERSKKEEPPPSLISKKEQLTVVEKAPVVTSRLANKAPEKPQSVTSSVTASAVSGNEIRASSPGGRGSAFSATKGTDQSASSTYRVGVGDVLDIRLLNSTASRSTLYTVIDGGLIDFPLAGDPVAVAGLTTEEIQARIGAELKRLGVQENAQLSVGVRDYSSHQVVVTGLVGIPGTKRLRREAVPLYVILAEAQPHRDAARATVTGVGRQALSLDLTDPSNMNVLVRPGDIIVLSARPQEFYYIGGHVNYPGQKNYHPGITLLQAILAASGFPKPSGDSAEISREGGNRRLSTIKYDLREIKAGKVQDPRLEAGDRVEVVK